MSSLNDRGEYKKSNQMKAAFKTHAACVTLVLMLCLQTKIFAFALLGPVQPWMQASNNVVSTDDIGGPMFLTNEYRWNVPVVTYGFDQSFLDFFGSNGVAAVKGAIQVLNNLPPASQMVLTNYPFDSRDQNYEAQAQSLYDLESQTLPLLLEHLGLAQPTRYIWVLRRWDPIFTPYSPYLEAINWPIGTIPDYIDERNYDPQTFKASDYVNSTLYTANIWILNDLSQLIVPLAVNQLAGAHTSIADNTYDNSIGSGIFYTGLTYDDVGGLAYLLSTNNVNFESLLPGVQDVGTNSFVNGAWRAGVDKITFVPQPVDSQSGAFLSTTNYYTDSYITNGILKQQQLKRIIPQPDFLFSVGDVTSGIPEVPPFFKRTGTTNWLNNATANGNTNGAGPGVIAPPVQIVFNKLGRLLASDSYTTEDQVLDYSQFWGSFDGSTNASVVYPIPQTGTKQLTVRMWLVGVGKKPESFVWKPSSLSGAPFAMQTSTNLANWTTLFTVTNNGSVCTYFNENPASAGRFYRLVPQ